MTEMKMHDQVFPFKCNHPECQKEYDLKLFAEVILLWGFIYLLSEENEVALIGLTCPACKKTTIQKYRAYVAMEFLWNMQKNLKDNYQINQTIITLGWWNGKYYSADHLIELGFIKTLYPKTESNNKVIYSFAKDITFEKYSKTLQKLKPFSLIENDIPYILDIENNQAYKAIPRTIPYAGHFCHDLDGMLLDNDNQNINTCLSLILKPNQSLRINPFDGLNSKESGKLIAESGQMFEVATNFSINGMSWKRKKLQKDEEELLLAANDLFIEEYSCFLTGHLSWKRKEFQNNVENFLNDLEQIRNRIDCEQIFRNKLINKYGRMFYYKTRTIEEQRNDYNEFAEIEEAGGIEAYLLDADDHSYSTPIKNISGGKASENNLTTSNSSELTGIKRKLDSISNQINDQACQNKVLHVQKEVLHVQKEILHGVGTIDKKIDKILNGLQKLQNNIGEIKSTTKGEEEKLLLIYEKMEKALTIINDQHNDEIMQYEEVVKASIDNWDKLDALSKKFLPLAEYLLKLLKKLDNPDYSPVILQFCKSLETEFLKKLFIEFTLSINKSEKNIPNFLASDSKEKSKTKFFAEKIKQYKNKKSTEIQYTFGEMNRIIKFTSYKNIIKNSPLLKEFKQFIKNNFKDETLFSEEYLTSIQKTIINYRNKCAHPNRLTESEAITCKEIVPGQIDKFLFSWNK